MCVGGVGGNLNAKTSKRMKQREDWNTLERQRLELKPNEDSFLQ